MWDNFLNNLIKTPSIRPSAIISNQKSFILNEELVKINYPNQVIALVSHDEIEKLENAKDVIMKDGILVKSNNNPSVYFISNGLRLPILNEGVFKQLGFAWEDIFEVSDGLISLNILGDPIDLIQENIEEQELLPAQESRPL